jgi:FlaA1/EpsC-like NDP-sugar epimerase
MSSKRKGGDKRDQEIVDSGSSNVSAERQGQKDSARETEREKEKNHTGKSDETVMITGGGGSFLEEEA